MPKRPFQARVAESHPPMPSRRACLRAAALVTLPVVLLACSRAEHPAAPPALEAAAPRPEQPLRVALTALSAPGKKGREAAWMGAIFGDAAGAHEGKTLARVTDPEGQAGHYLMSVLSAVELADGRTVVAVNAAPSDEEGNDLASHAESGVLGIYFLRPESGKWKVIERREHVTANGSHGHAGSISWVMLGPGKPGFILSSGGTWQGYTISMASIFDLADGVRDLGAFRELSGNGGACTAETKRCWEVASVIRFADGDSPAPYRDILVDFTGRTFTVTEDRQGDNTEHVLGAIRETARYRFDGKAYVLVAGTNPVPDI